MARKLFDFIAQLYLAGMSLERQMQAMHIFAEDVIPLVRSG